MIENTEIDNRDFQTALTTLVEGGVILYPTETVWGIGCMANNDEAIRRIFHIKRRQDSKAMISLVANINDLAHWVEIIPQAAKDAIETTSSPLTIIYDSPKGISDALKASDGTAAFRITSNPFAAELCKRIKAPLVSTSANISGNPTPRSFDEIDKDIIDSVDYVVKFGRKHAFGNPSHILKISNTGEILTIR